MPDSYDGALMPSYSSGDYVAQAAQIAREHGNNMLKVDQLNKQTTVESAQVKSLNMAESTKAGDAFEFTSKMHEQLSKIRY